MKKPTMDGLRQLVSSQQQNASQKETTPNTDSQAADWVWQRAAEIYGEQWVRENGETPSLMWNLALNKLDQSTVKNGIKQIIDKRIAWPPNLPKFLDLASGVDTDEAYEHMIKRGKPRNHIEVKVWSDCAFNCRSIAEDKSRSLFKKVYMRWHERNERGEMPPEGQKSLTEHSADKSTDRMVEERMRSNSPKTDLEKRLDNMRGKK